ncbi:MAG: hypothetical protein ABJH82_10015 [Polaribacter sp.]|uniref:hypothetical protein n=1 Tax=Polaribacter sp. TaxID=1920175 RepID=UPI0032641824
MAFALRPIYHLGYIAYFEYNIDYIIETYCVNKEKPQLQCNGKCHLAKQIAPQIDLSNKDIKGFNTISEAFFPVFKEKDYSYNIKKLLKVNIKDNWKLKFLNPTNFVNLLEQPPDFLS